ncbi:MAG: flagellar export chaperone FliS [Myxococcales bacterium]|jgi:flagellar protein FliS
MIPNPLAQYRQVQIRTSSPGELLIALYDGLFRFLTVAKLTLPQPAKRGQAGEAISRAYAIISELYASLDHSQYPELCKNLEAVYDFCMVRLTYANLHNSPPAIEEVMRVLTPIREAFVVAVREVASSQPQAAGAARR